MKKWTIFLHVIWTTWRVCCDITLQERSRCSFGQKSEFCVSMFQYCTHIQRLRVWKGLGDKTYLLFICTVQPPTPAKLGFQLVDNLSILPPEGWWHASVMEKLGINVMLSESAFWSSLLKTMTLLFSVTVLPWWYVNPEVKDMDSFGKHSAWKGNDFGSYGSQLPSLSATRLLLTVKFSSSTLSSDSRRFAPSIWNSPIQKPKQRYWMIFTLLTADGLQTVS